MRIFRQRNLLVLTSTLLCLCIGYIFYIFNCYSLYNKSAIERITSIPLDSEVAIDIFGSSPEEIIRYLTSQQSYEFEYEDWTGHTRLKLKSDGSVYLNDRLLYSDKQKVDDFLLRYASKGIFHISTEILFFNEYLTHHQFRRLSGGELNNSPFHIRLKFADALKIEKLFNLYSIPEADMVGEMWWELRHFGKDGQMLWVVM